MSKLKTLAGGTARPRFDEALHIVSLGAEASEIESWFAMQRARLGSLWVIAGPEHASVLEPLGCKFAAKGGHTTNYRSAWYLSH